MIAFRIPQCCEKAENHCYIPVNVCGVKDVRQTKMQTGFE